MMNVLTALLFALPVQAPEAPLTVDDASAYSNYGEAVAVSGDWAFVGAPDDAIGGSNYVGSVYAFERGASEWVERQKLTASNGALFHTFGHAIAADGERVVIGAPDPLGNGVGAAYVFKFDGQSWIEEAVLSETVGWGNDWFGWSVDIQGNRIVVGSMWTRQPGLNFNGPNHAGAAWVFLHDGTSWVLEAALSPADRDSYDLFGASVALDGETLVVGARGEGDNLGGGVILGYVGAVYVFDLTGGTWTETQKLRASNFEEHAWFGEAVGLDGDWLLIGSPGKTGGGIYGKGAAYMFNRSSGPWVETAKIEAYGTNVFGRSIAIDGDLAVVASNGYDYLGNEQGAVHPLRREGTAWVKEPPLNPGNLGPYDLFAQDVALDGTRMLTCAYVESMPPPNTPGAGYVYDLSARFHLMVGPYPLDIEEDAKFEQRFGKPGKFAWLAYSLAGPGTTFVPGLRVPIDLASPMQLAPPQVTDLNGYAQWEMPVPVSVQGLTAWFQGIQIRETTNLIKVTIR